MQLRALEGNEKRGGAGRGARGIGMGTVESEEERGKAQGDLSKSCIQKSVKLTAFPSLHSKHHDD